jgi:hypothetical protein
MGLLGAYFKENIIMSVVAAYFVVGGILKMVGVADILPRCLSVLLLGRECYGCGITTAMLHIFKLEFVQAYEVNAWAFILMPAGIYYMVKDFNDFKKRHAPT